jgi:hypothetical protein
MVFLIIVDVVLFAAGVWFLRRAWREEGLAGGIYLGIWLGLWGGGYMGTTLYLF